MGEVITVDFRFKPDEERQAQVAQGRTWIPTPSQFDRNLYCPHCGSLGVGIQHLFHSSRGAEDLIRVFCPVCGTSATFRYEVCELECKIYQARGIDTKVAYVAHKFWWDAERKSAQQSESKTDG